MLPPRWCCPHAPHDAERKLGEKIDDELDDRLDDNLVDILGDTDRPDVNYYFCHTLSSFPLIHTLRRTGA